MKRTEAAGRERQRKGKRERHERDIIKVKGIGIKGSEAG